jgi:hypothetical protein
MAEEQVKCGKKCEVFSRVVGYHRPVQQWNLGKQEEFRERKSFEEKKCLDSKFATLGKPTASAEKLSAY